MDGDGSQKGKPPHTAFYMQSGQAPRRVPSIGA
jgi:hypothetical protein